MRKLVVGDLSRASGAVLRFHWLSALETFQKEVCHATR
jgi:hypothetical protein